MNFFVLGVFVFFCTLLLALIGMAVFFAIKQYRYEKTLGKDLNLQGTSVTGQIVKHRVKALHRGCNCYLTYQYLFEGAEYEYEQFVQVEGFNSVRDGEAVEVLFLPQNPSTPRLAPIDKFQVT